MDPDCMTVAVNYFLNYVVYYENIIPIRHHFKACYRHKYDDLSTLGNLVYLSTMLDKNKIS